MRETPVLRRVLSPPVALAASVALHVASATALVLGAGRAPEAPRSDPAPALAGETFELPSPDEVFVPLANASPSPEVAGETAPPAPEPGAEPTHPHTAKPLAKGGRSALAAGRPSAGRAAEPPSEGSGSGGDKTYGAVGDRSAADLATAFTRGFAQASSMHPAWTTAPFGSAGEATLVLELDEGGHLAGHHVEGAPSAGLAAGIRSTLALIGARPFVAHGKVTRLHVIATISPSEPRDDMHGVYGIGGSFVSGEGHAFFSLPSGRKIDVKVRGR